MKLLPKFFFLNFFFLTHLKAIFLKHNSKQTFRRLLLILVLNLFCSDYQKIALLVPEIC